MLTFNAERHEYKLNGKLIPSVTTILTHAGLSPKAFVTPEGLERGTQAHREISGFLRGYVNQPVSPYASQALKFIKETGAKVLASELKIHCETYLYAGTIDLVTVINGETWVIDFKLNNVYQSTYAQLAAYQSAWNNKHFQNMKKMSRKRGALRLTEKRYQLIDAEGPLRKGHFSEDWSIFIRALDQYNEARGKNANNER